jgi:hypothetical protein
VDLVARVKGLLIAGLLHEVPGVECLSPGAGSPPWLRLSPGDYKQRSTKWVRQVVIHTTKGIAPQTIRPGKGPGGRDKVVAEFWKGDANHSAAHIVVDTDGSVACLGDLATICAYHATTANDWSVGIEMYQESDGSIYEATLASTVAVCRVICEAMGIPYQMHHAAYRNGPVERLVPGGRDCVGIYGHRDQTDRRGQGDPGGAIFARLRADGCEGFDFGKREDLDKWIGRQMKLRSLGETVDVDGICGPGTIAALRRRGFRTGLELDAAT